MLQHLSYAIVGLLPHRYARKWAYIVFFLRFGWRNTAIMTKGLLDFQAIKFFFALIYSD